MYLRSIRQQIRNLFKMNTGTIKYDFQCTDCGNTYPAEEISYLCPECEKGNVPDQPPAGVLRVIYQYDELRNKIRNFAQLRESGFLDLLPLKSLDSLPYLRIGHTPLYEPAPGLFFKDDSQNPTFSFKDRASALVSAMAKEKGHETIIAASTGNAGSSLAGICAAQKQKAIIVVPEKAPTAKLTQIIMHGARIVPVRGTYDEAFELSAAATKAFGWYNRNTAYNPFTIEGKKTVSFELFEQLGCRVSARIFVPVGDGVIISGVYKGFEDLLKLGLIDHMPQIVAVQAEGSDNLVRNLKTDTFRANESTTLADSISVDVPRNFNMARQFLEKYDGIGLIVSDQEILEASSELAHKYGLFAEPAAAAAYAGCKSFYSGKEKDKLDSDVVLLTGSGLKDTASVKSILKMPEPISPDLDELKKLVS